VGLRHVHQYLAGSCLVALAWRESSRAVGRQGVSVWRAKAQPQHAVRLKRVHHPPSVLREVSCCLVIFPTADFREPARVSVVVQTHHGGYSALLQTDQHLTVTVQRGFIPALRLWLQARPLNRKPQRFVVAFLRAVKILAPAPRPPFAGPSGIASIQNMAGLLFPFRPVTSRASAFHTSCGGRASPQKAYRKVKCSLWHFFLHHACCPHFNRFRPGRAPAFRKRGFSGTLQARGPIRRADLHARDEHRRVLPTAQPRPHRMLSQ